MDEIALFFGDDPAAITDSWQRYELCQKLEELWSAGEREHNQFYHYYEFLSGREHWTFYIPINMHQRFWSRQQRAERTLIQRGVIIPPFDFDYHVYDMGRVYSSGVVESLSGVGFHFEELRLGLVPIYARFIERVQRAGYSRFTVPAELVDGSLQGRALELLLFLGEGAHRIRLEHESGFLEGKVVYSFV